MSPDRRRTSQSSEPEDVSDGRLGEAVGARNHEDPGPLNAHGASMVPPRFLVDGEGDRARFGRLFLRPHVGVRFLVRAIALF